MDANEVLSVGILVVNDGLACHNIVAEMLRRNHYQVLHTGGVFDVLNAIWEIKDRLHLVLTNACKLEPNGNEICGHIERKLGIPVRCMCNDKRKIESKGQQFSFSAYVLNGLSRNNLNELGQFALEKEKNHEIVAATQGEKVQRASISNVAVETNKGSSSISDAARLNQRCKGVELNESSKEDHATVKKPRVVWSPEMHQRFLEAIDTLGYEKAVPKKIVEVMNIPGLTRENVASHLQKYRGCMKRSQEPGLNSFSSRSTRREYEGLGVLSSPATSRLNSLQTNVTTSPQSSYMSTTKESVSPSMSRYLNTCKDFSFDTTSERRNYRSTGGLLFSDRSGVDQLQQKHVPKLQLTPTFRIYGDQTRNMLLSIEKSSSTDNSNQSNMSKFVGYRVTSDGKSIEYGYIENSIGTINTEAVVSTPGTYGDQSTSYKHNPILDQNPLLSTRCISRQPVLLESHTHETSFPCQSIPGICANENPTQSTTTSVVNSSRELALLSLHSQNIEDFLNLDPSTPPSSTSRQYISVQPFRDSGHEEDTEKWFSILDQETSAQSRETNANVPPFQNPSENDIAVHNASTPSSMFPCDQDFSIPPLETAADDFPVQSPTAFFNSISQQQHSPSPLPQMLQYFDEFLDQSQNDDALLIETGSTSHQFDLEEFDDNLFSQDD